MTAATLTDFLTARLCEDEAVLVGTHEGRATGQIVRAIVHFDHRRLEAECAARRNIVERHERNRTDLMRECDTYSWETRALAVVYAHHPDYREEWRP